MALSFDWFWHGLLKRPYKLARIIEEGGGTPIVLLHGLGRTGGTWNNVISLLKPKGYHVIAFDLLGFGASPKPKGIKYDVDDHARAVIASLSKMRLGQSAIIVGHSMGCLVAVRVARLRPDLVRHLVLFEMPLYEGLPDQWRYRLRTNLYFKIYKKIMAYTPNFSAQNVRLVEKLAKKIHGLEVTEQTWPPFVKSLENTIMKQTASDDIKRISIPMDVIYGSFDMLVIRGEPKLFFGKDSESRIKAYTIRATHEISKKSAQFIVERVDAAAGGQTKQDLRAVNE